MASPVSILGEITNDGARGRVCRRHFYSPEFLELELLRLLSTVGRPFHIVKKCMARPVCTGIGENGS
jgi:hypothetical protein